MSIYIYNSLTRKKDPFQPLSPPEVNIYTCGVTVYDECHIGHARSLYIFDVIRKYLKYRNYKVNFVRNITDLDDKIINRAKELKLDWRELIKKYIDRYHEDLKILGIEKADHEPRATENIEDMIKHIQALIDKGYAYVTNSGVYFSVRKFSEYGKLSGQSIDQMFSGARIEADECKEDPLDFALWKSSKEGEPSWKSLWRVSGRPGWHIECSTMSMKYLNTKTLDIHAGGRDLIFPHHENEVAQSEALTGKPFAKYWIHHGLLTINGQKMAKSLGNFISIRDFVVKYYDVNILKLFFLSAHYSHPIDYNDHKIKEAGQALQRFSILIDKIEKKLKGKKFPARAESRILREKARGFPEIETVKNKFIRAMDDDFNTPQALASIFELVNIANKNIDDLDFIYNVKIALKELLGLFGISFERAKQLSLITDKEINLMISQREKARKNKDYALADKLRKELEEKGIILEDTKEGTVWRRKL